MKKIKFPLYHGTSTLFTDSIKEFGLGGVNIVEKYNLIPELEKVYTLAKKNIEYWRTSGWFIENMINQKSGSSSNWLHGPVFFSPSKNTATRYAITNPFGSEILSYIIKLYQDIQKQNIVYSFDNEFILSVTGKEYSPVLITVNDVSTDYLESERNTDVTELIEYVEAAKDIELECQQANFRLLKPINAENIDIKIL